MMFGVYKTKHSGEDWNRCLFVLSKIDILWSSRRTREFINVNFEQVIEPFLVFNIYSYQWLIALFTRVLLKVTVYYYYVAHASEAVARSCSIKKAFLEIFQNLQENVCARVSFLKKRLLHRCFPVNFMKF